MTRPFALILLALAFTARPAPVGVGPGPLDFWTADGALANLAQTVDDRGYGYFAGDLPGRYAVTWSGTGTPTITGGASTFTATGPTSGAFNLAFRQQGPGGDVFEVHSNGVANLAILAPDALPGTPFRAPFVNRLAALTRGGVVRAMDWMRTNDSPVTNWADRATVGGLQTTAAGVAPEYIAALANATGSTPWVNIPAKATDAYVTSLATLMRDQLDPALKVRVEYSNELWNSQFTQSAYNATFAAADPTLTAPDSFGRAAQRDAARTAQIAGIFASIMGPARVVPVLAGQAANTYWLDTALAYLKARGTDLSGWHIAIAPYVPGDINGLGLAGTETKAQIFAAMGRYMQATVKGWIGSHKVLADRYGVTLDSYEAHAGAFYMVGPDSGPNAALADTIHGMQESPEMADLWRDLIGLWGAGSGGGLFTAYGFVGDYSDHGDFFLTRDVNGAIGTKEGVLLASVPEPAALALAGVAVAGLGRRGRRCQNSSRG